MELAMKPDLVIVPDESKEPDMRARIEEIRTRANPCGDYSEYWHALNCQPGNTGLSEAPGGAHVPAKSMTPIVGDEIRHIEDACERGLPCAS